MTVGNVREVARWIMILGVLYAAGWLGERLVDCCPLWDRSVNVGVAP